MAVSEQPEEKQPLSSRIEEYRVEAQKIVARGIEHPCWELKRGLSIAREELKDRLDFIKLIQGLANAHQDTERFVIIGADQRSKAFVSLTNFVEFDPAKVSDLLSRYLDPIPLLEVFNGLETDEGDSFVLIVLNGSQPRPIVVKTEGQVENGPHVRPGEIWIKRDTRLELAARLDLEKMYAVRIEAEAEGRARKRFAHLREELTIQHVVSSSAIRVPTADLILGPRETFQAYVLNLVAEGDEVRYGMLIEIFRDAVIAGWRPLRGTQQVSEYMGDRFLPALASLVEAGFLFIKNSASATLLTSVGDVLQECFDFMRTVRLPQGLPDQTAVREWEPALKAYEGLRALAVYAVFRSRFGYLPALQKRFVLRFTSDGTIGATLPFAFWPFSSSLSIPIQDGLVETLWTDQIGATWGSYFGSPGAYQAAACQYEFILELSSWIGLGYAGKAAADSVQRHHPSAAMAYVPDLWRYPLRLVVPIAQQLLSWSRTGNELIAQVGVVPESVAMAFSGDAQSRTITFGKFINHIRDFHEQVSVQQGRFPGVFEWEGGLAEAAQAADDSSRGSKPANQV